MATWKVRFKIKAMEGKLGTLKLVQHLFEYRNWNLVETRWIRIEKGIDLKSFQPKA